MAQNNHVCDGLSETELIATYLLLATEDDVSKKAQASDAMRTIKNYMGHTWAEQEAYIQRIANQVSRFAQMSNGKGVVWA